jgi:hypothetical protein
MTDALDERDQIVEPADSTPARGGDGRLRQPGGGAESTPDHVPARIEQLA